MKRGAGPARGALEGSAEKQGNGNPLNHPDDGRPARGIAVQVGQGVESAPGIHVFVGLLEASYLLRLRESVDSSLALPPYPSIAVELRLDEASDRPANIGIEVAPTGHVLRARRRGSRPKG